ncbi:LysR family transcriptional regulator ArgP [Cognatishimia sp. MH4019]|uniref:LysR family transcriptional regulator ArgP n=1 Tax=Cognatishimia sp. MH4019 TaxID=2854030 RepID=UPI001CD480C6|nr:LysR family transcriptional regulator ArgP [Cognatishimia sp. MH4019]
MYDPTLLATLSTVARCGSFDLAAAQLSITQSAVSQRIKTLEDRVGTVLIERGTPSLPTAAGARLIRHADEVSLLEQQLARDMALTQTQSAPVRIAVNADSLDTWVLPALAKCEGLLFDLVVDDQDHSARWLRQGDVAAAITSRADPIQGCDSVPLGALRYRATASPAFMARYFADGVTETTLRAAPALTYSRRDRLQQDWVARQLGKRVPLATNLLPSTVGFVTASLLGLGWGMNPEPLVRGLLDEGQLIEVIEGVALETPLYWQISRITAKPLKELTKNIQDAASTALIRQQNQP